MPMSPQVESPNVMVLDFADSPDLRDIFYGREIGDKLKLTFELQLTAKTQETATLAIEKVITDSPGSSGKTEATPTLKEPIMASMHARQEGKKQNKMGPHNRPPQTVQNSAEPWLASYA